MSLIKAAQLLLKGKSMGAAIKKVAPTVSKELSEAASARSVHGWAKRMQRKLRDK